MTYGQWLQITIINDGLSLDKDDEEYIWLSSTFLSSKWGIFESNSSMEEYVNAIITPFKIWGEKYKKQK